MVKAVVTGGAGFIGSNLVERLVDEGSEVTVIDNMHTGSEQNLSEAKKKGNVSIIKDDAKNIFKHNISPEVIFHLGIYSSSPMYKDNPMLVSEVVGGMIQILEFARSKGIPVVFASTSSIYNGLKPPHKESMKYKVTDYYTEARIACERLGELYHQLYNVNVIALRLFSVYGEHEEAKKNYANVLTQFLWKMKRGETPVIYGDGNQKRDFIYVGDVVQAFLQGYKMAEKIGFGIFNVGTGKNYSFNDVVALLNSHLGKSIKPEYKPMPIKNYVYETLADTRLSKRVLKFEAKTSIEEGIEKIIKYYK